MRKLLGALALALSLAVAGPLLASPAGARGFVASDETKVQNLVNATRQSKGLGTLVRHDQLVQMARGQSARQAEKGSIFHNNNLGGEITSRGLDWRKVGENVGVGPNVDLIEDAFLASPHHYENIVDPEFNAIGVGVVDGADGRRYVTQVFAALAAAPPKPAAQSTPAAATAQPAAIQAAPAPATQPRPAAGPSSEPVPPAGASTAPAVQPSDPNVVVGGVIEPVDLTLPAFNQAKRAEGEMAATDGGPLTRFVDLVTFWS